MPLDPISVCLKDDSMMVRTEGSVEGYDGTELFFQTWMTSEARGTLVVTHGISEHSEAYDRFFAPAMSSKGWNIIAWDLRGHGCSHGKRGYIEDFKTYSDDMASFITHLERAGKLSLPYALVAHSMGALINLRYLLDHGPRGAAAIALSSPLLGISLPVPPLKDIAARVLARVAPTFTLFNEIHYEHLSRDPEVLENYPKDPLRHDKISPQLYLGMMETIAYVRTKGADIDLPILVQLAGRDRVVSRVEIEGFFASLASTEKRLLLYEESYHEIFNDLDRERVFDDLDAFLKNVMRPK